MPNFRYRALTQNGEIVHGTLSAPTSAEVARRIEYLRLLPIETVEDKRAASSSTAALACSAGRAAAEVTTFTRDLALLLKAGARLDDALELLAERRRCRPAAPGGRASCGPRCWPAKALPDAVAGHPALFPPMYVALVRVGEVSGTLDQVLEMLGTERARSEQMRRKLTDAMQYPAFVLIAAVWRDAVLHPVRAAAIFDRAAGFRREIGYRARRLHQVVGFPARQRAPRRC